MIKKFWCWLWGHRTVWKDYTAHSGYVTNHQATYCTRCGKSL